MNNLIERRLQLAERMKDRAEELHAQAVLHHAAAHGRMVKDLLEPTPPATVRLLEALLAIKAVEEGNPLYDATRSLARADRLMKRAKRIYGHWRRLSYDDGKRF